MKVYKSLTDPEVATRLQNGEIGLIPTDTVYGLVCVASLGDAVDKVSKLKGRTSKKGVTIAANIDQLVDLGIKKRYLKAVEEYWPGPVSVVVPCNGVINNLDLGTHYMGVRIPDDKNLNELLEKTGALLTSSANKTGEPPITNIEQATSTFKDSIDFYVDGGDYSDRESSALIQIIDDAVEVIRPGHGFN